MYQLLLLIRLYHQIKQIQSVQFMVTFVSHLAGLQCESLSFSHFHQTSSSLLVFSVVFCHCFVMRAASVCSVYSPCRNLSLHLLRKMPLLSGYSLLQGPLSDSEFLLPMRPTKMSFISLFCGDCTAFPSALLLPIRPTKLSQSKSLYLFRMFLLMLSRPAVSEVDLRDPGSSHLDWLYRSFMTRNRVTSSKPLLIFSAPPVFSRAGYLVKESAACALVQVKVETDRSCSEITDK